MAAIDAELQRQGLIGNRPVIAFAPASFSAVARVHEPRYLDMLAEIAHHGGNWLDPDTYCGHDSLDTALLAAGASIAAVDAAIDGTAEHGFVIARPPGHHANRTRGMGFCLLNNVAIAAARGLDRGLERIAIVDFDVHHGNGTQDIFYRDPRVLFISIHQHGHHFYPGTGAADERGADAGEGFTINVTLASGQDDTAYLHAYDEAVARPLVAFSPELVLISAGFDAHRADPIGDMRVTEAGFAAMTARLVDQATRSADNRVVALLEGGYDPPALGRSVAAVLKTLDCGDAAMYDASDAPSSRTTSGEE